MASTRSADELFLIGIRNLEPLVNLNQLPTQRQVLQRFHYYLKESKSVRDASHLTVEELAIVWSRAAVPLILKTHAVEKLEKIHNSWLLLKKNKGRHSSAAQQEREIAFAAQLESLFDIAHADALTMIRIEEDRKFLDDQRTERKMFMSTEDKELAKKRERAEQRWLKEEARRKKVLALSSSAAAASATDSLAEYDSSDTDDSNDYQPTPAKKEHKQTGSSVTASLLFDSNITGALDRNKTSDREAVRLMVPIVAALGHDPSSLPLSRSTIHRMRQKARKEFAEATLAEYNPCCPLVVHWDGKILPEIFGQGKVDRLPILVSGDDKEKLLGVPKLAAGTGEQEAEAVYSMLNRWKLVDQVQAMSFDTTSGNTGHLNGACTLLEKKIGRELLWLACRHHVMELILSKVFTVCCGPSSAPDIPIFKRFRAVWAGIVQNDYRTLDLKEGCEDLQQSTLQFLAQMLERDRQIRDDYQELIELTMVILGSPPEAIHWRSPGPVHHARWMAKLLYAMKIILFRDQRDVFQLTRAEETRLERFVQFGVLLYSKAWTKAPLAAEAAAGDLELWNDLKNYEQIDNEVGQAARSVLERHLWYLSDETVGLALFSEQVTPEDKELLVYNLSKEPSGRKVRGNAALLKHGVRLGDFATSRTADFFTRLEIDNSFVSIPPSQWNDNEAYQTAKRRVQWLRVVNDTAERGVKLFEEFNTLLTKDEDEKQFLLQVVEANRKAVPTEAKKKDVIDAL